MISSQATGKAITERRHQIVFFGGHGSSTIFSSVASERAQYDAQNSVMGSLFLSRCHAAFLEECLDLEASLRRKLNLDVADFQKVADFLVPPESLHNNPIIQAATICLYQLLRYFAEIENPDSRPEPSGKQILEAVGVCSGLLPAIVVATSSTTHELLEHGVAAFRLAFRIARGSATYGLNYEKPTEKRDSWTLIVVGSSQGQVCERLESFYVHVSKHVWRCLFPLAKL